MYCSFFTCRIPSWHFISNLQRNTTAVATRPVPLVRRADTPFRQQRVTSFLPILQPLLVVGIFLAIGVAFIPLGKWFIDESEEVRCFLVNPSNVQR